MRKQVILFSLVLMGFSGLFADEKKEFKDKYQKEYDLSDVEINRKKTNFDVKVLQEVKQTINTDDVNLSNSHFGDFNEDVNKIEKQLKSTSHHINIKKNIEYLINDKDLPYKKSIEKYTNHGVEDILMKIEDKNVSQGITNDENIYIFISSSLSKELIQNYFEALQNVNQDVVFIIRGTIGSPKKIMPTLKWIKDMLTKDDGSLYAFNIYIDPERTLKHNIEAVPALLYSFEGEDYLVYGGVSPIYAIEKIRRDVKSERLNKIYKKLNSAKK